MTSDFFGFFIFGFLLPFLTLQVRSSSEPLVPLVRFFDRHRFKDIDNAPGQDIEKRGERMSNMHPAMTVLQELHIRGRVRIFELQQVLLDDPPVLILQAVNVLQCPLFDGYSHGASLFSVQHIQDRHRARRILRPLQPSPGGR